MMNKFDLTDEEDLRLRFSIMLPGRRGSLYEHLCQLPLEDLQAYPRKGYRRWMGCAARSPQALALRDYILYWRLNAMVFRLRYPRKLLESFSSDDLQSFLRDHMQKTPLWAYEALLQDVLQLLAHR